MLCEKSIPNFAEVTWVESRMASLGFEPVRALSYRFVSTCAAPNVPPSPLPLPPPLPPPLDPELPELEPLPPELPEEPPEPLAVPSEPLEVDASEASDAVAPSGEAESTALGSFPGAAAPSPVPMPHASRNKSGAPMAAGAESENRDRFVLLGSSTVVGPQSNLAPDVRQKSPRPVQIPAIPYRNALSQEQHHAGATTC
jgi:hypothetical protein